ncbi:hypothetical protein C2E23DRAFT_866352 [Lenzites betulinus]|nr:hypothetical protein C2E23DRAFT_866352 [Lenzites betulinus]
MRVLQDKLYQHMYYDGTGLRDFASVMSGGRVVPELTSETCTVEHPGTPWYKRWGVRDNIASAPLAGLPPEFAIYPDTHVGSCWPMKGSRGSLGVALAQPTIVTSFTVDHIPRRMTFRYQSAPRSGQLWGLAEDSLPEVENATLTLANASTVLSNTPPVRNSRYAYSSLVLLGSFYFDIDSGEPFRTYNVSDDVLKQLGGTRFSIVVFVIGENWGNDEFTCLYRVRVHSDDTP